VSTPRRLEQEAIAFSHDSSPEPIPSVDEILSGLSELRGDITHLSELKSEEDKAVEDLFQALMTLTQLLQWATVETSVLSVELGEVVRAKVTPEGKLIYCRIDGEIGTLDLSDYDNRDVLVEVVRDLAPKLREILENPPEVEEPVVEEPEPELEPEPEPEPVLEEKVVEELDIVEEAKEPITEPAIEGPVAEEEPEEQILEEPSEPPTLEPPLIEEAVEEKPPVQLEELEPQKTEPKDRKVELLWAVLRGRRVDSLKEIRDYRARREEEDRRVMEALRKGKEHGLVEDRSFFERLKDVFSRRRKKR
jgi:hypothetical protein